MDNEVSICCFYAVIRITSMLSHAHTHIYEQTLCVCVAFIRSTDTNDVIIPVSSSDDASVLGPPSAVAKRSSKQNTCCDL